MNKQELAQKIWASANQMRSKFAANAGKKAGEFYTPHEVSLLMSEIVADHLKGRSEVKIYENKTTYLMHFNGTAA